MLDGDMVMVMVMRGCGKKEGSLGFLFLVCNHSMEKRELSI